MLELSVNQATGLMGLGSGSGAQLIAVVSHGDESAELPLLWQLCGALVELGYPVSVLDATKQETEENPGLSQLLDYRFGHGSADSDTLDWNVVPAAIGIHDLCLMQSHRHPSLQRLGSLFPANSVVILYANADWLVHLLGDSQNQPLLAVSSGKNALLTSYLALKRLLINGRLTPTILNMMQHGKTIGAGDFPTAAAHLSACAQNFSGISGQGDAIRSISNGGRFESPHPALGYAFAGNCFTAHARKACRPPIEQQLFPNPFCGNSMMYTAKGQLDRNALIKQYQPLVRRLAHHMMAKLPPSVEVDDLIQVGLIGLSEALTRYEAAQGVPI